MKNELITLTAQVVAGFVSHNRVDHDDLPKLMQLVYSGLKNLEKDKQVLEPAVPIKQSVFPNHIVCLEDGVKLKMLKRHLRVSYNLTPEQYREKWNLSADYPMTAPNYAKVRSRLAKAGGLGSHKKSLKKAA